MAMDGNATGGGAPRFSVGVVISTSLSVLFANIWSFLAVILAIGVPAVVLAVGSIAAMMATAGGTGVEGGIKLEGGGQILLMVFVTILMVLAYLLIQAAMTYGALQSLRGRKAGIGACISSGLAALPRAFVAALLFSVGVGVVGFVLGSVLGAVASGGGIAGGIVVGLAISALFAWVVVLFWVFIPAIVVERAGPIDCFIRSLALTKGRRWAILGILALVFVANLAVNILGQLLAHIAPVASGLLGTLAGLFFMALSAVLAAVGYYFLRAEKEGVAIDDVVAVFD